MCLHALTHKVLPLQMPVTIYNEASCRRHYGDLATAGFCYADDQTKFCRDDINVFVAPWGSPMACTMKKGGPVVQVSMLNWAGTADPCEVRKGYEWKQ